MKPKIHIGGNVIIMDDDFMIQGSSFLELASKGKLKENSFNFDTILSGMVDKEQIRVI